MKSWWDLGEGSGRAGFDLAIHQIACPFCSERGNFETVFHVEKKKPNSRKKLNFDTLKCGNCAGFVFVLWSASSSGIRPGMHDFRVLPWPIKVDDFPGHWPEAVGRFWKQAHRNISDENWDAAAVMARSSLQAAMRQQGAVGGSLKEEVNNLGKSGILPPIMVEWSHELRLLGNESAHPKPDQSATDATDAKDIVNFLDFLLEYLYNLPNEIADYKQRKEKASDSVA